MFVFFFCRIYYPRITKELHMSSHRKVLLEDIVLYRCSYVSVVFGNLN